MAPVFDPVAVILANWGQPAGDLCGHERPTEAMSHSMADGLPIDDLQILAYRKNRLAPSEFIKMETSDRLTQARKLAEEMHRGQTDKLGVPYIYHVLDVANRVKNLGEDIEIVGLLHDAVEDASPDRPLTLDEIEVKFGKAVCDGVDGMTKRKGEVEAPQSRNLTPVQWNSVRM